MLDILSNGYVMMGMVVAVLGLAAVLFLTKKQDG
jgi:LPXTG-motif cell wall-anchored protein